MLRIRPPAVAQMFYPGQSHLLQAQVKALLEAARPPLTPLPKALIAPHAGYTYSGPIAASAYKLLAPLRQVIRRVVLLGPAHRVYVPGLALPQAEFFATPLGEVAIERKTLEQLAAHHEFIEWSDAAHRQEHSLEVHLPFLQIALEDFQLLPLLVGVASVKQVAQVLEELWGGPETLVVVSSDLSHFHDYATAQRLDLHTAQAIECFDGEALDGERACGHHPLRGLLAVAPRYGLKIQRLDLRNSADTAGTPERVVGYGAWALSEATSSV